MKRANQILWGVILIVVGLVIGWNAFGIIPCGTFFRWMVDIVYYKFHALLVFFSIVIRWEILLDFVLVYFYYCAVRTFWILECCGNYYCQPL